MLQQAGMVMSGGERGEGVVGVQVFRTSCYTVIKGPKTPQAIQPQPPPGNPNLVRQPHKESQQQVKRDTDRAQAYLRRQAES